MAHDQGESRGGDDDSFVVDQNSIDSAEESDSTTHTSTSTTRTTADTNTSSTSSSFVSFSSSDDDDDDEEEEGKEDAKARVDKLGMQHAILGDKLSQLLRDKAAAENIKKQLNDGLLRAKARIKAIEQKLGE